MPPSMISAEHPTYIYDRKDGNPEKESPSESKSEVEAPDTEVKADSEPAEESRETERPSEEDSDDLELKADLESVPKHARAEVQKYVEKFEKDFKGAYTKKTQALAEKRKSEEIQRSQMQAELDQYKQVAQEVLHDPSKLEAYRKLYGIQNPAPGPIAPPPQIQTVEDLIEYNQRTLAERDQKMLAESERRMQQLLQKTESYNKWDKAVNTMRADPKFVKYEKIVTKLVGDPEYKAMYNGSNELDVLQKGFKDFKAMLREDLAEKEQSTIKSMKSKSRVSTVQPKTKTVQTDAPSAASKEEVIARVRARLGE